jgi:hypothetical protein
VKGEVKLKLEREVAPMQLSTDKKVRIKSRDEKQDSTRTKLLQIHIRSLNLAMTQGLFVYSGYEFYHYYCH